MQGSMQGLTAEAMQLFRALRLESHNCTTCSQLLFSQADSL